MGEDFYWYWLNNIKGIGRKSIRRLLEVFQKPSAVYYAAEESVLSLLRTKEQKTAFLLSKQTENILHGYQSLVDKKISFVHPESEKYPEKLRTIPDAPFGLYIKGKLPPENQKAVAIIGARNCSRYGKEMARFFGRELSSCGVSVVSGLARGIDAMAHIGALEAGGYTLGILGGGIDQIYPQENFRLFMQMERMGGILSESNIGVAPTAGLFPQRNRLIAGMCDGILVVEAMEKSGTFITVDQGLEQGKEIFALPGRIMDIKSVGCNNLIKLGAYMVTEVEDILGILQIDCKTPVKLNGLEQINHKIEKMSLAPLEKMVYSCLRIEPKYLDDIIFELKIAPQEVCMALNQLVLSGIVAEPMRNYYAIRL